MKKYTTEIFIIVLLAAVALCGVASMNFSNAFTYVNQYGQTIAIFGSGIYSADSYFKAPIFIGTDFCILLFVVPLFTAALVRLAKNSNYKNQLRLVSIKAVCLYYAVSLCFGVKYNRIFVLYVLLFSLLFFSLIKQMMNCTRYKLTFTIKRRDAVFLIFSGISLCIAWLPDILPAIFSGNSLNLIENYTTEATYILDLGIISPLCFICFFLLKKCDSLGVIIYAILLQSIIVVAAMMITQSAVQFMSGANIPLAALVSKSAIFVVLGAFALMLDKNLYAQMKTEN